MPSGHFLQRRLVAVNANHREPGGGQILRRRPAVGARADHDRHPLAHLPVTFVHGWSGPLGPKSRRVECRIMNVVLWTNALTSAAASTPVYLAMIGSAARSVIVSR